MFVLESRTQTRLEASFDTARSSYCFHAQQQAGSPARWSLLRKPRAVGTRVPARSEKQSGKEGMAYGFV